MTDRMMLLSVVALLIIYNAYRKKNVSELKAVEYYMHNLKQCPTWRERRSYGALRKSYGAHRRQTIHPSL